MATAWLPRRGAAVPQLPFQIEVAGNSLDLLLLQEVSPLSKPVLYSVVAPCLMLRSSKASQPLCNSLPTRTWALYALNAGTLNEAQRQTVQALRAALLTLAEREAGALASAEKGALPPTLI